MGLPQSSVPVFLRTISKPHFTCFPHYNRITVYKACLKYLIKYSKDAVLLIQEIK